MNILNYNKRFLVVLVLLFVVWMMYSDLVRSIILSSGIIAPCRVQLFFSVTVWIFFFSFLLNIFPAFQVTMYIFLLIHFCYKYFKITIRFYFSIHISYVIPISMPLPIPNLIRIPFPLPIPTPISISTPIPFSTSISNPVLFLNNKFHFTNSFHLKGSQYI